MRIRYLLSDLTLGLQVLVSLLVVAQSARFAWIGVERTRQAFHSAPAERDRQGEATAGGADAPSDPGASAEAASDAATEELPKPRRRQLLVDLGPNRSEVYVNGRKVGQTPYVGQISCRDGEKIRIDVVPPEGMPQERTAICRGNAFKAPELASRVTKEDLPSMKLVEERMKEIEDGTNRGVFERLKDERMH